MADHANLRRFLTAFFFYIDGVLTIIVMAADDRAGNLRLHDLQQVIILFLIVQFSAMAGAFALARADRHGSGPRRC